MLKLERVFSLADDVLPLLPPDDGAPDDDGATVSDGRCLTDAAGRPHRDRHNRDRAIPETETRVSGRGRRSQEGGGAARSSGTLHGESWGERRMESKGGETGERKPF